MTRRLPKTSATDDLKSRRSGFTLIEVVIALIVSSLLVLTGRQMLEAITEGSRRVRQASESATIQANGDRLLRDLVGRLETGSTVERGFGGTERQATFSSWCEVPAGWLESCRVMLDMDSVASENALVVTTLFTSKGGGSATRLIVRRGFTSGALRYLSSASDGGVWFHAWGQGITAPLAIGIIIEGDTAIVAIGERG